MLEFSEKNGAIIFTARVVPRASKSEIIGEYDGGLKVRLSAPPVDGAANAELIKLLSKKFGVSKRDVEIISGETAKIKQIKIENLNSEMFLKIINI